MGEIADMMINQMIERQIALDLGIDYFDAESKTRNSCKQTDLHWKQTESGWRLFEGDIKHECPDLAKMILNFKRRKRTKQA